MKPRSKFALKAATKWSRSFVGEKKKKKKEKLKLRPSSVAKKESEIGNNVNFEILPSEIGRQVWPFVCTVINCP